MLRLLTALMLMTTAAQADDVLDQVKQVNNVRYADYRPNEKTVAAVLFDQYDQGVFRRICDVDPSIEWVFIAPLGEFNKAHRQLFRIPYSRGGLRKCES